MRIVGDIWEPGNKLIKPMAIQENGPNGPFKGKVGSVYGYKLNGQNIIRGARNKNRKPPTEAMLLNQQKMKVANDLLGL